MVFSSLVFLFWFFPALFLCYALLPFKRTVLLVFSILFYAAGEPVMVLGLLLSSVVNYYCSTIIEKKHVFLIGIIFNIAFLGWFKYAGFVAENLKLLFGDIIPALHVTLPIGISFYTFQAMSYLIDVHRGDGEKASSYWEFLTYLSLFPQLIAGPIVRYEEVKKDFQHLGLNWEALAQGIERFIIGLAKKVLFSNVLGLAITKLSGQSVISYWLEAVYFMLQIYFDFSGYSDMAIGLGLMLGFHFPENFQHPYLSKTVTEFWRRWHMTLSRWFRDYVYIPLGGNRQHPIRNLLIVWALTGLWHGAAWNFVIWGMYFGVILIIEKKFLLKNLEKHPLLGHLYTLFIVLISFVIFENASAFPYMFGFKALPLVNANDLFYFKDYFFVTVLAAICCLPVYDKLPKVIRPYLLIALLIISIAFLIDESYNPFLYFRF